MGVVWLGLCGVRCAGGGGEEVRPWGVVKPGRGFPSLGASGSVWGGLCEPGPCCSPPSGPLSMGGGSVRSGRGALSMEMGRAEPGLEILPGGVSHL